MKQMNTHIDFQPIKTFGRDIYEGKITLEKAK